MNLISFPLLCAFAKLKLACRSLIYIGQLTSLVVTFVCGIVIGILKLNPVRKGGTGSAGGGVGSVGVVGIDLCIFILLSHSKSSEIIIFTD